MAATGRRRPYPELETYSSFADVPPLYSGSFGLGSRDLQPEGLIGAIENMLPGGERKKQFYLSIDFLRDEPLTPKQDIHQDTIESSYPARAGAGGARQREPQPDAQGQHHGALPFHRRLGRDHHRQEPGHDPVRPAGLPHQGQPQIRLGEKGPAHHLLPVGGAGTHPHQLRILLRRRGAVARPQRVPPHQRAGRPQAGRCVDHPERAGLPRRGLGRYSRALPAAHRRPADTPVLPGRVQDRPGGGHRHRAAIAHAGYSLPGRILRRLAAGGTGGPQRGETAAGDTRPAGAQVWRQGRPGGGGQRAGGQARL